jgi:hypothetical protein
MPPASSLSVPSNPLLCKHVEHVGFIEVLSRGRMTIMESPRHILHHMIEDDEEANGLEIFPGLYGFG